MSSWVEPDDDTLEAMTAAEREACWRELDRERVLVEVRLARFGQRLGGHGLHLVDGHRSVRGFARAACNWSTGEAARFERLGRLLDRYPQVSEAVAAGELGSPQLHLLARLAGNPRVHEHLDDAIGLLVSQACTLDFDDLVIAVARWESLADENGTGDRHERAHRNRNAHLHVGDYGFVLDANGANTVGVQLQEILDAFIHSEFLHDWEAGVTEHGDEMCPARMARSDAQRRADALHAIFLAATGGSAAADARRCRSHCQLGDRLRPLPSRADQDARRATRTGRTVGSVATVADRRRLPARPTATSSSQPRSVMCVGWSSTPPV